MTKKSIAPLVTLVSILYSCNYLKQEQNSLKPTNYNIENASNTYNNLTIRQDTLPAKILLENTDTTIHFSDKVIKCTSVSQVNEVLNGKDSYNKISFKYNELTKDTIFYVSNQPNACTIKD